MHIQIGALLVCAIAAPAGSFAQSVVEKDGIERAVVPLRDPSRPARVNAHLMEGGITVRGYDGKDVIVEAHPRLGREIHQPAPARADGMKRLDLGGSPGLDVSEENNVVEIRTTSFNRPMDFVISVPRRSSLEIKCMNDGDVNVEHVEGDIDANNLNGKVTLRNVSGSVVAHSLNGEVLVTLDRIDPSKPMSFSTMNGDIDVTLPGDTRASVRMKTDNGEIFSDFDVKLSPNVATATEPGRQPDGSFRIHFDSTVRGAINGGGPEYQFTSFNGKIYIRKRK